MSPLLLETCGGSFLDESDPAAIKRQVVLDYDPEEEICEGLLGILPAGVTSVAITPITTALVLKSRREANDTNFQTVFERNRGFAQQAFGFDVVTTRPTDPTNPSGTQVQKQYAMVLGGVAQVINAAATDPDVRMQPNFELIWAVIEDLSDGRIDGLLAGEEIPIGTSGKYLPQGISLNREIDRFRNNNAPRYAGVPLVTVNEAVLSQSGADPLACVEPPDGLAAWYPGDGNADDIQSGNNGSGNSADFVQGMVGEAFFFNGDGDYVEVDDNEEASITGSLTLKAWVKPLSYPGYVGGLISKWNDDDTDDRGYTLIMLSDGKVQFGISEFGDDYTTVNSSTALPLDEFTHVAAVFDSNNGTLTIYLNGNEAGQTVNGSLNSIYGNDEPLLIGAADAGGAGRGYSNALIDEVGIFERALTPDEVLALYNAGSDGMCKPDQQDSDGDGLSDDDEINEYDTDPHNPDTDGDGLTDGDEVHIHGTYPDEFDSDGDFLGDGEEISLGTDPKDPDMDGDSVGDGIEIRAGSDPDIANLVYHVGTDTCDDGSPNLGTTWGGSFCTNAAVQAQLQATTGGNGASQALAVFVLYDEHSSPGPLSLDGATVPRFVNLVGSLDGDAGNDYKPGNPTDHDDTSYTRFDGDGSARALDIVRMANVYLQSLELVNGHATRGAGLYLADSNGAGWDLVIKDNVASVSGGGLGLGLLPSSFTLYGGEIIGNTSVNGGGFYVGPGQDLVLSSTYVADNKVTGVPGDSTTGNGGGGMVEGSFVADGVIFANNSIDLVTGIGGNGGGLFVKGTGNSASVDVRQCLFLSNSAVTGGGISYVASPGDATLIRNSLFVGNLADSGINGGGVSSGGALHILDEDAVSVLSNTFAYNEALSATGSAISGGVRYDPQGGTDGLFSHNIFWFNIETDASPSGMPNFVEGVSGSTQFTSNNNQDGVLVTGGISANPMFLHGFYLSQVPGNPSVDGGSGDLLGGPFTTSIDGTPDSDELDIGFHYVGSSTGLVDAVEAVGNYSSASGPVPVEFKPVHNEQLVGPGRLIGVCLLNTGSSAGLVLKSVTTINPVGSVPGGCRAAPVLATDHGDGTYQVNVDGNIPGTVALQIFDNAMAVPGATINAVVSR